MCIRDRSEDEALRLGAKRGDLKYDEEKGYLTRVPGGGCASAKNKQYPVSKEVR